MKVPYTAYCPLCEGHRTFTVISGALVEVGRVRVMIGCCVCGMSEGDALHALSEKLADDRDTIGELAGAVTTLGEELAELRDEVNGALTRRAVQ